jgi:hypothetical protein
MSPRVPSDQTHERRYQGPMDDSDEGRAFCRIAGDGVGNRSAGSGTPPRAGDRVLSRQFSRRLIEHGGDAGRRPQLHLRLSALEYDRHRGSGSNRGGVCWVRFAQRGVASAAAGMWSRSTARVDCGNVDSRGLPQEPAFLRLALRLRVRPPAACGRSDALERARLRSRMTSASSQRRDILSKSI